MSGHGHALSSLYESLFPFLIRLTNILYGDQILTDTIPYQAEMNDMSILRAIMENRPPANIATFRLPEFIIWVLDNCWKRSPEARPHISRCVEVIDMDGVMEPPLAFYLKRTRSGSVFCNEAPAHFMTVEPSWWAVHAPNRFTWGPFTSISSDYI